jgi:hypothetical protein
MRRTATPSDPADTPWVNHLTRGGETGGHGKEARGQIDEPLIDGQQRLSLHDMDLGFRRVVHMETYSQCMIQARRWYASDWRLSSVGFFNTF